VELSNLDEFESRQRMSHSESSNVNSHGQTEVSLPHPSVTQYQTDEVTVELADVAIGEQTSKSVVPVGEDTVVAVAESSMTLCSNDKASSVITLQSSSFACSPSVVHLDGSRECSSAAQSTESHKSSRNKRTRSSVQNNVTASPTVKGT